MDKVILKQRFNKHAYGLLIGAVLPMLVMMVLFLLREREAMGLFEYAKYLYRMGTLLPLLSVATLVNLAPFYLFKRLDMWYMSRGVVFSIFLYLVFIVGLKVASTM